MNFVNKVQQTVYENVASWLASTSFDFTVNPDHAGFTVQFESTGIFISTHSVRESEAYIHLHALVTENSRVDAQLMEFLIRENTDLFCGAFSLDKNNAIWLEYSLLGSSCDRNEFTSALGEIASIADEYDDEIIAKWGGTNGQSALI